MKTEDYHIDFVVTWVDCSDPEWRADFEKYSCKPRFDDSARYRNWDLFRYWFRAVEAYAPWVHKVFLVTNGRTPDWINKDCPKLVCVSHSEFIPKKYLPTFNSRCIELNFGRIEGLAEHFVYFNDDMYLNAPVSPSYYFRKGLPCDYNYEKIVASTKYDSVIGFGIYISCFCNIALINKHFNRRETVREAPWKWFGLHLRRHFLHSLVLCRSTRFNDFEVRHVEQPFLKETFTQIWEKEPEFLNQSCTRFREHVSLTQYFAREWQFATNNFYPIRMKKDMRFSNIMYEKMAYIKQLIFSKSVKSLCLNDSIRCSDEFFDEVKTSINSWFEMKFPKKSSFEL